MLGRTTFPPASTLTCGKTSVNTGLLATSHLFTHSSLGKGDLSNWRIGKNTLGIFGLPSCGDLLLAENIRFFILCVLRCLEGALGKCCGVQHWLWLEGWFCLAWSYELESQLGHIPKATVSTVSQIKGPFDFSLYPVSPRFRTQAGKMDLCIGPFPTPLHLSSFHLL